MDNYNEKMENNVLEIIKQKEQADKRLLSVEIVLMVISIIFLFAIVAVIAFVDIPLLAKIVSGNVIDVESIL